jgi:hypothetical protein
MPSLYHNQRKPASLGRFVQKADCHEKTKKVENASQVQQALRLASLFGHF